MEDQQQQSETQLPPQMDIDDSNIQTLNGIY